MGQSQSQKVELTEEQIDYNNAINNINKLYFRNNIDYDMETKKYRIYYTSRDGSFRFKHHLSKKFGTPEEAQEHIMKIIEKLDSFLSEIE